MPDAMDAIQREAEQLAADAVQQHANRPRQPGRTTCDNADCGEPISAARTALGARLCLECQTEEEARNAHFRSWRGPR
jgi:RNA polymerase-binding transcription factor DksA